MATRLSWLRGIVWESLHLQRSCCELWRQTNVETLVRGIETYGKGSKEREVEDIVAGRYYGRRATKTWVAPSQGTLTQTVPSFRFRDFTVAHNQLKFVSDIDFQFGIDNQLLVVILPIVRHLITT